MKSRTTLRVGVAVMLPGILFALTATAAPLPPVAPGISNGDYTVTLQTCGDACGSLWIEERVEPNGAWQFTDGTVIDQPPGLYSYRTGAYECSGAWYGNCSVNWSSSVPVRVIDGELPRPAPLSEQLGFEYVLSHGNVVGDAGTDLLVTRTSGPDDGNGIIDAIILQQAANGEFVAVVPDAAQHASSLWQETSLTVSVQDMNADGYADIALRGLSDIIPAATDQIIFASANPFDATPKGIRSFDESLQAFTEDLIDYTTNNQYFMENAPWELTASTYSIPVCDSWFTGDYYIFGSIRYCYAIFFTTYDLEQDFSAFNQDAVAIWRDELAVAAGTLESGPAAEQIVERVETVVDVSIGGWDMREIFGDGPGIGDVAERRGLEAFLAILGIGTARADEIEPEDAAAQVQRGKDVVYIVGRYVFGSGLNKLHTALLYREAITGIPTWYSAFDSDKRTLFDGTLVAKTSAPNDSPLLMRLTLGEALPPGGQTRFTWFFGEMRAAHDHYRGLTEPARARYDAIPEVPCGGCNGRNSNGYVNGLVRAARGAPQAYGSLDFAALTGWEYPVESHYFGR